MKIKVEVCVDSIESCLEAVKGGADRLELCSSLFLGGLTPSYGMMKVAREQIQSVPVFVMIRPRAGDFFYSKLEIECMKNDIIAAKDLGFPGVVLGCLRANASVDTELLRDFVELASPMSVTFHRAFDMCRDYKEALSDIYSVPGIDRILTSGLESTVLEGLFTIKDCMNWSKQKEGESINRNPLIIVPGGGITERNLSRILSELNPLVKEFHISGRSSHESPMTFKNTRVFMGGELRNSEFSISIVDHNKIENFLNQIQ